MYYVIYKTTNLINGKYYIGKHQTKNINDRYFGSGKAILDAIKKYGKKNFSKEILYVFDNERDMNLKEKEIITEEYISTDKNYNMGVGGEGGPHFKGRKHSPETLKKITEANRRKKQSPETRAKIANANKNRIFSKDTIEKLSGKNNSQYGTRWSWINDGQTTKRVPYLNDEDIPEGWKRGIIKISSRSSSG